MRKILTVLMICSILAVAGCGKKGASTKLPKSVQTYQQLQLTPEQNKQVAQIREKQRTKIDALRDELAKQRKELLDPDKTKGLTPEQVQENQGKYRTAANDIRVKIAAERVEYDNAIMKLLDDKQKKTYQQYLDQREKEKGNVAKNAKRKAAEK